MTTKKIIIRGEKSLSPDAQSTDVLQLVNSYKVSGSSRGHAETHEVDLQEDYVVELVFDDDTIWLCSKDTIKEVFPEAAIRGGNDDAFEIPIGLITGDERGGGIVGTILIKVINVFTRKKLGKEIKHLAENLEKKLLDNKIGLYLLNADFSLYEFTQQQANKPYLIFLHGTATSTEHSFGAIKTTTAWKYIRDTFGNNVIAFQHETLTKGPLENTLDLVNALPKNISLHIISQSHGGVVGDILSRFCNGDQNNSGFTEDEIKSLKKSGRAEDVANIEGIKKAIKGKNITIERFIRVACPAGGSILASKRLDNFLNVVFNIIGTGTGWNGSPLYIAFKNVVAAVINCKNDENILPGIEALNPDSPFVKVLNIPQSPVVIDNSLIVISGNCKMKINLKALLVIVSKLFFRQDNDLIVNTSSMYLGSRRSGRIQYFFNEGAEVDHFSYFKNKLTTDALLAALETANGSLIPGFSILERGAAVEGDRNALLKLEMGQVFKDTVTGTRPIVVLLPGIMGSNLAQGNKLVWIDYLKFIAGDLTKLKIETPMTAPSIIRTSYKKLVDYLSGAYDVVTFPFDWRIQLNDSAKIFNDKIKSLLKYKQPIKVIGHSMGGVLVRDFIISYPQTWNTLNQSSGFKLIFLGAPLGGSFRIPAVMFGKDSVVDKLSKIDIFHSKKDLLNVFSKFPGLLSLLPFTTDSDNDFSNINLWNKIKSALPDNDNWPLPLPKDLQVFKNYRDKIRQGLATMDYSNAVYIAGRDKATPCAYQIEETSEGTSLQFLSTAEGDASVTWETGIPKKMTEHNSVYYVNVTHGALANETFLFPGIADILIKGSTNLFSKNRPVVRGEEKLFRSPEYHDFDLSAQGIENTILGLDQEERTNISESPLSASITQGDLRFASYPVLAGHFDTDGILFAEKTIDCYLNGALSQRHRLGLYPGEIGSSEVLLSGKDDFKGAIIVGLGDPGALTSFQLAKTVEQGITNYLLLLNDKGGAKNSSLRVFDKVGISSLVIASGYGGISVENALKAILLGVSRANEKVKRLYENNVRLIEFIEFIELYKDRALNSFYALNRIEQEQEHDPLLNVVVGKRNIRIKPGSRDRLPIDTTEGWWMRIRVDLEKDDKQPALRSLQFSVSTGGAREEVRRLHTSKGIIDHLINDISTSKQWTPQLAKTIFELLLPNDFKERLKRQNNINWILDETTASYPWELLQDGIGNGRPLCINAGMIRQLAIEEYRTKIDTVTDKTAMVVGDPNLNGFASQLPGALKEGTVVDSLLRSEGFDVKPILNGTYSEIIQTLFSYNFKIIHLAGHGVFNEDPAKGSGMLIGKDVYLSSKEINQMSTVPEFVFVNCCFLGKTEGIAEEYFLHRYKLAANVGTQLIRNGVKAVIAAGWAVDDRAALEFTETFYKFMFEGYPFGEAVQKAREVIYTNYPGTNTWGAYQCYGDPFYRFTNDGMKSKHKDDPYVTADEALVDLENLRNATETNDNPAAESLRALNTIIKKVDKADVRNGSITEKEALIYAELYEYDLAIEKFKTLLKLERASFSFSAMEKYCNIRAKKCWLDFKKTPSKLKERLKDIDEVIIDLEGMVLLGATAERLNLLGSAFERKAILLSGENAKDKIKKTNAYTRAAFYYQYAHKVTENDYAAYSIANWIALEYALIVVGNREWGKKIVSGRDTYTLPAEAVIKSELGKLKNALVTSPPVQMDYWNLAAVANIELVLFLLKAKQTGIDELINTYRILWGKAGSKGMKQAEIEHLEILVDAFSLKKVPKAIAFKKSLQKLIDELMKIS